MKLLNSILTVLFIYVLIACSGGKPETVTVEKKVVIAYALQPRNIYWPDTVDAALKRATEIQKAESRRFFMTGLDLLANKNDAASSIEYFKEAICFYPDAKNYQHLFKAYLKNNELTQADSVNNFLYQRIDEGEVTFNFALVAAARKNEDACVGLLDEAVRQGFTFKERITEEKLFDFLKNNQSFQAMLVSRFSDESALKKNLFTTFMAGIPDLALPYAMPADSSQSFNFDHYINYDFALFIPGMEDSRFSRDVSNEYMYVGSFNCEAGKAFIYKSYRMIADTLNPVSVNLVVYDSLGTIVSQQEIGCFCSPLESKGFKIWQDFSFEVSTYKTTWQFDPLEKGYAGNKIVSKEQSAHNTYKITKENLVKETAIQTEVVLGK